MDDIADSMDLSLSRLRETVKDREGWHAAVHRIVKSQTRLSTHTHILLENKKFKNKELRFMVL